MLLFVPTRKAIQYSTCMSKYLISEIGAGQLHFVTEIALQPLFLSYVSRVVKSSRLPAKITAYFVTVGRLLCLVFLYGWRFQIKFTCTG